MQIIVLAPHPDDAAFSVGGLLAGIKETTVQIITCFSRNCTIERADSLETTRNRSQEDDAYASFIGAELVRLGLPDSGVRTNVGREELPEAGEKILQSQLPLLLRPLLAASPEALVFVPLAIGGHPDHIHCRQVALKSFAKHALVFYEDLPYGQFVGGPAIVSQTVRDQFPLLEQVHINLPAPQMKRKMEGMDLYKSQLHPIWRKDIETYAQDSAIPPGVYGERYWTAEQPKKNIAQWMPR